MPKYKVISPIQTSTKKDKTKGKKVYQPGEFIELSKEEAEKLAHAVAPADSK